MPRLPPGTAALLFALLSPSASPGADGEPRDSAGWSVHHHASPRVAQPPLGTPAAAQLILDDGTYEAEVGLSGATAFQFLWLNRFDTPAGTGQPFDLEEIQVLFPAGPGILAGAAVELVVYTDLDSDPTTGAVLVATLDETIQVADGVTFSVYPLVPAVRLPADSGDILVGVVNRFVTSGVSPPSRPAALDTTSSAGRSWVASWSGDPPDPPTLPSDDLLTTIDAIEPGNWMIRAAGTVLPVPPPIPVTDGAGLALLAALLALAGAGLLSRRLSG